MLYQLIIIPFISAFIGYLTNIVAIKLLFWPQRPIVLGGFKLQGLLPKRQADIARSVGEIVEKELLSLEDVLAKINTPQMYRKITAKLVAVARDRLNSVMPSIIPSRFIRVMGDNLERVLRQEVPNLIRQVLESESEYMGREIRVKRIVEEKINSFDLNKLERMI
ncbi:MAG: DUF445 family protein, partial [Syntrophomonadaceae bacterium]|nr:DUF445 family protein [Syntrophomonadaceae bacterium]